MSWWETDLDDCRLGDYRIEHKLGEGGMAEVFLAVGLSSGVHENRRVAIKVPLLSKVSTSQLPYLLARFKREVRLQSVEDVKGVVTMLGAGESRDRLGVLRPYLVMSYLSGGSLADRLGMREALLDGRRSRPQTLEEILQWLPSIAQTLDSLHGCSPQRLHRDVKPDNILFNQTGEAFLSDFGIATLLDDSSSGSSSGSLAGTPGSPGYQAPESYRGEKLAVSDQFGLGVTVYEALSGHLPVKVRSHTEYIQKTANWNPSSLQDYCPGLPKGAALAVMKAISGDPEERHSSCIQFARILERALNAEAEPRPLHAPPPSPPKPPQPPRPPRRSLWLWTGVVAVAAGLAGVGWYMLSSVSPSRTSVDTVPPVPSPSVVTARPESEPVSAQIGIRDGAVGTVFRDRLSDGSESPAMVVIPAGSFVQGSPETEEGRLNNEGPRRTVRLRQFAIGQTEVTFADYDRFATATGRAKPADEGWGRGRRPVINVSWRDALAYAEWLSTETGEQYRLPSESEWEYAARAGTVGPYSFAGMISPGKANYDSNHGYAGSSIVPDGYRGKTVEAGSLPANPWGLHEVHGNVGEWVQDCANDGYYHEAPTDGSAWMSGDCERRVLRSASWGNRPRWLRSARRNWYALNDRDAGTGFRLARDLVGAFPVKGRG